MKKIIFPQILLLAFCLCGCQSNKVSTETRFILDTVATITAECSNETLDGAFEVCEKYEDLLSRTKKNSAVYKLNHSNGFVKTDVETLKIIEKAIYYSNISDGKFDITVMPVVSLWNFNENTVPSRNEIAEALKNVDYEAIEIKKDSINLNGKQIDLGGIAKGYIADRLKEYLTDNKVSKGIINLGGNVIVFGEAYNVGIAKPFTNELAATLRLKNKAVVTSGIYQRYIEKDGQLYHHIIDPDTGYGVENELASVTIIGDSSMECDALSTVCMLLGTKKATELIENTPNTEAVFISRDGILSMTKGLYEKENLIYLK